VTVTKVLHSRQGVETWVTSDGRAYFVELDETERPETNEVEAVNHKDFQVGQFTLQTFRNPYLPRV